MGTFFNCMALQRFQIWHLCGHQNTEKFTSLHGGSFWLGVNPSEGGERVTQQNLGRRKRWSSCSWLAKCFCAQIVLWKSFLHGVLDSEVQLAVSDQKIQLWRAATRFVSGDIKASTERTWFFALKVRSDSYWSETWKCDALFEWWRG